MGRSLPIYRALLAHLGPTDEGSIEIEGGPGERDYTPGYYAVFFLHPDGLKLEVVHQPPRPEARPA
jgi:hypothetical protein